MNKIGFASTLKLFSIIFIFILFFSSGISAQQVAGNPPAESRWVFGGDFGLGFSSYGSNILISPQVGYKLTPAWEAGVRLTYNYYSYKDRLVKFSSNNYGGGLYTSYVIFKGLFVHLENELLSYQRAIITQGSVVDKERIAVHSVFIGGGYRQYFSSNSYASIMILYNLNETLNSPYENPMFRVGFGFGL
ncbi:MAG: hypothetical protein FD155_2298 [Bacteroidetes bacterium]|nr:MAG: hypothetical protein FD155_2298 [Bacteroidota bacterium]